MRSMSFGGSRVADTQCEPVLVRASIWKAKQKRPSFDGLFVLAPNAGLEHPMNRDGTQACSQLSHFVRHRFEPQQLETRKTKDTNQSSCLLFLAPNAGLEPATT